MKPTIHSYQHATKDSRVVILDIPAAWEMQLIGKWARRIHLSLWLLRMVWRETK